MKFEMVENYNLYDYNHIELQPGITYLVTANGNGKTTFLSNIKYDLESKGCLVNLIAVNGILKTESKTTDNSILLFKYDAEDDNHKSRAFKNDLDLDTRDLARSMFFDSEGQNRMESFNKIVPYIGACVQAYEKLNRPVIITIDAIDSGLDISYCKKLREFFDMISNDIKDKEIYVVVSANQFALIENYKCLDVNTGKYNTFNGYREYEKFIQDKVDKEKVKVILKNRRYY